ncbi:hypothetical protein SEA_ZUCKER_80 [Arthrobacter phage Zucker]|nr:hypothetical protein SEA_ZUCKER_80 [Arthrobacter phage Zucker]
MSVTKLIRKARKVHPCDVCWAQIQPGDSYLTHTALAGDDYYHDALDRNTLKPAKQPIRIKECAECATRYGRAEMLAPTETNEAVPTGAASSIPKENQ